MPPARRVGGEGPAISGLGARCVRRRGPRQSRVSQFRELQTCFPCARCGPLVGWLSLVCYIGL